MRAVFGRDASHAHAPAWSGRRRRSRSGLGMIDSMGTRPMCASGPRRRPLLRAGRVPALRPPGSGRPARRRPDGRDCTTPTRRCCRCCEADPPDAVVIALHGATGEDGSLRGVLDLCGVPYVGCDARASRLAWDKPSAKSMLREAGIPTPDWVALPHDRFSELGAVGRARPDRRPPGPAADGQAGPGRVRAWAPRWSGRRPTLPAAMVGCFAYDSTALVERFVPGTDVAVSIVDLGAGPDGAPRGRDRPAQRRVRLRGPLHGRPDDVARTGPAVAGGRRTGWPRRRWRRTRRWGCATCPGST